jgi:hypothetical protein
MVQIWKDPATGKYGLKPQDLGGGRYDYWAPVDPKWKPEDIRDHGTAVIFLGRSFSENTTVTPSGVMGGKRWIQRYLNGRFFRLPADSSLHVHEGWELPKGHKHNFYRAVDGLEVRLNELKCASGSVPLTDATAHWWILKEGEDTNAGHFPTPGICAALWQGELYDMAESRAGNGRLQQFGIIFGLNRVAVIVQPDASLGELISNTARTQLLHNNESLPWTDWAAEFREKMPSEIVALMEEVGKKSATSDHRQSIRDRLREMGDLFRFSRYQRVTNGKLRADPNSLRTADDASDTPVSDDGNGDGTSETTERIRRGRTKARAADYFSRLVDAKHDGAPAEEALVHELPDTYWVSVRDATRAPGEMEDRAAQYIPEPHTLKINGDFRVFTDMISRWSEHYKTVPGAPEIVRNVVREWFEQQLVEAVLSAKALEGSKHWTSLDVQELWSEKALTAVVLPRFHVDRIIKRTLGERIASLSKVQPISALCGETQAVAS